MPTYAKDTDVPVDRSRGEIERTLERYGASAFMYGWEEGRAVIGFQLSGRRYRIILPLPPRNAPEFLRTPVRRELRSAQAAREAWEQAVRQRWRALALWIKAVLEAAETGITTVQQAMQPFTVLPDGSTVGDWLEPQLQRTYETGYFPPILPGLPDKSDLAE